MVLRPDIRGRVEDQEGSIGYEVLEVRNGNALIWSEPAHPRLPRTASGGFGWIEPLGRAMSEDLDFGFLRGHIERRLRAQIPERSRERSAA